MHRTFQALELNSLLFICTTDDNIDNNLSLLILHLGNYCRTKTHPMVDFSESFQKGTLTLLRRGPQIVPVVV